MKQKNQFMECKRFMISAVILFQGLLVFGQQSEVADQIITSHFSDALIGGLIGGFLGVIGTILSSYYGPKKLETWRSNQKAIKHDNPRKKLLLQMLEDKRYPNGRRISTLSRVIGASNQESRRLLIEIEARGIMFKDDFGNEIEGWALIKNRPLDEDE